MPSSNRASARFFLLLFLSLLALFIWMIGKYWLAIVAGAMMAALLKPLHARLSWRRPAMAACALTIGTALLVIAPMTTLTTMGARQAVGLAEELAERRELSGDGLLERVLPQQLIPHAERIQEELFSLLRQSARAGAGGMLALAKGVPLAFLYMFLSLLSCYFFLVEGGKLLRKLSEALPLEPDIRHRLLQVFRDTTFSAILANMVAAAIQSLILTGSFLGFGVPAAYFAGASTFIAAWVPILGSAPIWLSGVAYLYTTGRLSAAAVLALIGLMTAPLDHLIRPLVLKGRGTLHPLIGLIAIFGGIQTFGIFGLFFGPVLAAMVVSLFDLWPTIARRHGFPAGDSR
ncbi:MAG: AI-2E family transporter [Elusimicrobia bacterium]|nr:AI-2E family transporter [Elusimicrobiota bacterium]